MESVVAPSGNPIVAALRICYAIAGVAVTDGKLEWNGKYEVAEDRSAQNSRDQFIFIDSKGAEFTRDEIDWQGVTINLEANNS